MNERIRELAEQASTFAFTEYPKQTMATFNTNKSVDQLFNQKFAQLIVQECIGKIELEAVQYAEPVWAVELLNDIREHFGVEQ